MQNDRMKEQAPESREELEAAQSANTPGEPEKAPQPAERPVPRRGFFRELAKSFLSPAADVIEAKLEDMRDSFRVPESNPFPTRYLRPPGAPFEQIFIGKCERSGRCAEVCPVKAIKLFNCANPSLNGTPYIVPSEQPCVVCDGLECMDACPSEALRSVPKEEVSMGLADVNHEVCTRTQGEDCTDCLAKCPVGTEALSLSGGRVTVHSDGCIGCGVCEHYCPTWPKAIVVNPAY